MADISKEVKAWQEAVYGEEVRQAQIDLSNKLNTEVETATATVKKYESAEAGRVSAESNRASKETERLIAETNRKNAETDRVTKESDRVTKEAERVSKESARVSKETERLSKETERVTAEAGRVAAESNRVTQFGTLKTASENATKAANTATTNANTAKTDADKAAVAANTATNKAEAIIDRMEATPLGELQIGGRNLVVGAATMGTSIGYFGSTWSKTATDDAEAKSGKVIKAECLTVVSGAKENGVNFNIFPKTPAKIGKIYTWSIWIKSSKNITNARVGHECGGWKTVNLTTGWQKLTHTWKFTDASNYCFIIYSPTVAQSNPFAVGDVVWIRDSQIEESTIESDYTPSVEDTQAQIDAKKTDLWASCYSLTVGALQYYKLAEMPVHASYNNIFLMFTVTRNRSAASTGAGFKGICALNIRYGTGGIFSSQESDFKILASNESNTNLGALIFAVIDPSEKKVAIYAKTSDAYDGWRLDFFKSPSVREGGAGNITVYNHLNGAGETVEPAGEKLLPTYPRSRLEHAGGVIEGPLQLKQGHDVHKAGGTAGADEYVRIALITVSNIYANSPITITITQRERRSSTLEIRFANSDSKDPSLLHFFYRSGYPEAYLYRSTVSTWGLYIKKSEGHDTVSVTDVKIPNQIVGKVNITWTDVGAGLPAGAVKAVPAPEITLLPETSSITDTNLVATEATDGTRRKLPFIHLFNTIKTKLGLGTAATQNVANNATTTAAGFVADARMIADLQGRITALQNLTADTGWLNVLGTSAATANITPPTAGSAVRYRKIGKVVYLHGSIGIQNLVGSDLDLFTLPAGYRPPALYATISTATGNTVARVAIKDNGVVQVAWVRNVSDGAAQTGGIKWIGIDTSFPIV